ncbi:MAG: DUF169 domain-containing protein [Thermoplasmata archaeon]|nr:DUF169 domain-containing protein [Candidatus Sysuiplasma acidicola]MBX8646221.1 DUF169 domain-containing protein [Candidatus Sysuiplasma acidicola]MDH2905597.1 DUF169 domain-containing protein [Methanomassiliicoccales archaeon]
MEDDLTELSENLKRDLKLESAPVQISYLNAEPLGIERYPHSVPAGCSFWGIGTQKEIYAPLSAHENCEIGAFVLGIRPSGELGSRLSETLGWMEEKGYLGKGEAAKIPHNSSAPEFVYYGPLGKRDIDPTAVVMFCRPSGAMIALEAASLYGAHPFNVPLTGRPACSVIPFVLSGRAPVAVSMGCSGFRTYVDAAAGNMLIAVRGDIIAEFASSVAKVAAVNVEVCELDAERKKEFTKER